MSTTPDLLTPHGSTPTGVFADAAGAKHRVGSRTTLTMRGWARTRYGWQKGAQWARNRREADWCDRMNGVTMTSDQERFADCGGSAFLRAAVRAYWRSECDAFAQLGEAFGICSATEWPGVSKRATRRDSGSISSRIWHWAMKRWGREVWPSIEYRMRERTQNEKLTDSPRETVD